jgi:hypothetical protein
MHYLRTSLERRAVSQTATAARMADDLRQPVLVTWAAGHAAHASTRVVCSMHMLAPVERVALGEAVLLLLVGLEPPPASVRAWLLEALLGGPLKPSDLCHMAMELAELLVSLPSNDARDAILVQALKALPQQALVDLAVSAPGAMADAGRRLQLAKQLTPRGTWLRCVKRAERVAVPRHRVRKALHQWLAPNPDALRPDQRDFVQWAYEREVLGPDGGTIGHDGGGVLAASPGLGKTRMALMLCLVRHAELPVDARTLILAPLAIIPSWIDQHQLFLRDELGVSANVMPIAWYSRQADPAELARASLLIMTPELFLKRTLSDLPGPIERLIIDEVHAFAREGGGTYTHILDETRRVRFKWGLTGTPFRNRDVDIRAEARLLDLHGSDDARALLALHFYQVTYGPYTVELPPCVEQTLEVQLSAEEREFCDVLVAAARAAEGYNNVLATITWLREATVSLMALDPAVFADLVARRKAAMSWVPWLRDAVASAWLPVPVSDGDEDDFVRAGGAPGFVSSKFDAATALLRAIHERHPHDKVLVFSSFAKTVKLLRDHVTRELYGGRIECAGLFLGTAETTRTARKDALKMFKQPDSAMVLLLTNYSAGGTGIDGMQVANHVIMLDPPFTDATDEQAVARVRRVKQRKTVYVYRLFAPGSIEEALRTIRARKAVAWEQLSDFVEDAKAAVPEGLTMDVLEELIREADAGTPMDMHARLAAGDSLTHDVNSPAACL